MPYTFPVPPRGEDPAAAHAALVEESVALNQAMWDERAPAHAASLDYAVQRFYDDPDYLSDVVRFDLPRLGDVAGLRGVHLQCHIGTDTVSLARLGARMTGLDFSPPALAAARELAAGTGADVDFVHADVRSALEVLPVGAFDLVFTGIGALCWLPRVDEWAGVVATLLAPGGRLFLREGHPVLWALDDYETYDPATARLALELPYFETEHPLEWSSDVGGTYVATDATFTQNRSREWNHGLGEIVTALLDHGLRLTQLVEHTSVPWEAIPGAMVAVGGGEWQLADRPQRLPHSYTLQAQRPT